MTYGLHPSAQLRGLFDVQALLRQGQDLEKARVIIVGLDANYLLEISAVPTFFERIVEYQRDGVQFWQKHGVHHP